MKQIAAIYKLEGLLSELSPEERQNQRELTVKPLVEVFFAWIRKHWNEVLPKSEIGKGFTYRLNQEKYLKVFLEDGNLPADNNATKANNLKPYNYFELLLTEIPKHMEDTNLNFLDNLLPWLEKLTVECKKQNK